MQINYFQRFTLRHAGRSPATTLSLMIVIALGVAVLYSVRLANRAAVSGFQMFTQSLSGGGDLIISTPSGRVPISDLPNLRKTLGNLPVIMLPVVEATAALPGTGLNVDDFDAKQITLVGLDLMSLRNLSNARASSGVITLQTEDEEEIKLGENDRVYLTKAASQLLSVDVNDSFKAIVGDKERLLRVAAILTPGELDAGKKESVFLMDLPAVQELTEQSSYVDRVDIFIPEGESQERILSETIERLETLDTSKWIWIRSDEQRRATQSMTAAFQMNLTILSGLSLIVGLYLILQALEAAVVRRRNEIGILRSLGIPPKLINRFWLIESIMLGSIGSGFGLIIGWLLAQGTVQAIARTVNALYMNTTATAAQWDNNEALLASSMGILVSLLAGWVPAKDAANTPPIQAIRQERLGSQKTRFNHSKWGLMLVFIAWAAHLLPPIELAVGKRFPAGGYISALCALTGAAMLSGSLLRSASVILKPLCSISAHIRIASGQLKRLTGRHRLTVAGIVAAVGMAAGMDILIHSFEKTVTNWIGHTLKADLFVAVKGVENASNQNKMSEETWKALANDPDVASAEVGHIIPINLEKAPTFLVGMRSTREWNTEQFIWIKPPKDRINKKQADENGYYAGVISESFSRRYKLSVEDTLDLPTPSGTKKIKIKGIFADYGNERGSLVIDSNLVCNWFNDYRALNFAATLKEGLNPEIVKNKWSKKYPGLTIRTNSTLREEVIIIFNQTFAVTHALKAIGIFVAIAGLALALYSLVMERKKELEVQREIGFRRKDIATSLTIEGLFMSIYGLLGGLLISIWLGYVLVFVINKQSFGWTLEFGLPGSGLSLLSAGIILASVATCFSVGYWSSTLKADQKE